MLLNICSTGVTRNRPTNVTQNLSTSVTQNWFHKRYSKFVLQMLLEIDPQTLLKIGSKNVT